MVFGSLELAPVDAKRPWPGSVQRWVNVRALSDKAVGVSLVDKFGPRVDEVLVDNATARTRPSGTSTPIRLKRPSPTR